MPTGPAAGGAPADGPVYRHHTAPTSVLAAGEQTTRPQVRREHYPGARPVGAATDRTVPPADGDGLPEVPVAGSDGGLRVVGEASPGRGALARLAAIGIFPAC